jgi:tetratricopeptide (TPR) repeat protein
MLFRSTLWTLCLVLLLPASANAGKPEEWTDAEVNMAAPYCMDTMGFRYGDATHNTSPRAAHWVSIMGQTFWAMHHYCWAMVNLNKAQRASMPSAQKKNLRETAINDIRYVLGHAPEGFIMLPEIYTTMGNTYLLLGNARNAEKAYKAAIKAKPDYWPPYARWAEYLLIRANARDDARSIVREGLTQVPASKTLLSLWKELGGGPLPPPVEKPGAAAANPVAPADEEPTPSAAPHPASTPAPATTPSSE